MYEKHKKFGEWGKCNGKQVKNQTATRTHKSWLLLNAPDSMKFVYNLVISGAKGGIFADLKRPSVPAAH